jgi:hypothetical protein
MAEEIIDSSVWIKKTHDPKWNLNNITNKSNKVVCCVRNPYDTIASCMHFLPTLIQSGQINEKFTDFPEVWDKFIKDSVDALSEYQRRVETEVATAVPTLIIRFEDLRSDPKSVLEEIFCFLLDVQSVEGLNV